jgi:hypothetical protein
MQLEVPEFRNKQRTQTLEPADGIERQRQEASGKEGGHEMMDQSAESNYLKSSPTFPSRQFLIHPTPHEGLIPTIPGHFPFAAPVFVQLPRTCLLQGSQPSQMTVKPVLLWTRRMSTFCDLQ